MKLSELYRSIQGESGYAGWPCFFIRTAGCNLKCNYCDTPYAREGGRDYSLKSILREAARWRGRLVQVTGGEPLLQEDTVLLCRRLLEQEKLVLLETNGSLDIGRLPRGVVRIIDLKCPDSGMSEHIHWPNLELLRPGDELKFVLSSRRDYLWARRLICERGLAAKAQILFSAVRGRLDPALLARWILEDELHQVRLQLQLHKYLWPDREKGV